MSKTSATVDHDIDVQNPHGKRIPKSQLSQGIMLVLQAKAKAKATVSKTDVGGKGTIVGMQSGH